MLFLRRPLCRFNCLGAAIVPEVPSVDKMVKGMWISLAVIARSAAPGRNRRAEVVHYWPLFLLPPFAGSPSLPKKPHMKWQACHFSGPEKVTFFDG